MNFCLKELYHDILAEPTLFSIRAVWHMMTKIQSKIKINASADPEVIVQISRDNVVRDIYGYYEVRGEVTVDNHQTDAQDVKLSIAVKKGRFKFFRYEPYPVLNIGNVPSGATAPFSFRVKFDDDYDKPSFAFGVKCEYRVNNIAKTIYSLTGEVLLEVPDMENELGFILNNEAISTGFAGCFDYFTDKENVSEERDRSQEEGEAESEFDQEEEQEYSQEYSDREEDETGEEEEKDEYILPYSSELRLYKSDLEGLTKDECRIARNEIYARHGRRFKDEELQRYFDSKDWYEGTIDPDDFNERELSRTELDNLDLIMEYEKEEGYR